MAAIASRIRAAIQVVAMHRPKEASLQLASAFYVLDDWRVAAT